MAGESGRDRMLNRLVGHVRTHGLPMDPSLRRFADELGTSHRMLAYYFGSREGLLATVLAAMRAEEREFLRSTAENWNLYDATLAMWAYYTDPSRLPEHRSFFYVYSLALQQPGMYAEFLASLDHWVALTSDLAEQEGSEPTEAARRAQLIVSSVRGLLMDRLTSSDPARVDAAFALLVDTMITPPVQSAPVT